jgi:ParB-like chromosome segregation protein Spo0J
MGWRDHLKVHPACDLFPLMSEDELKALGDDIKKNGLQKPIVLWALGCSSSWMGKQSVGGFFLLDGRNRLDAMELVGMETIMEEDGAYFLACDDEQQAEAAPCIAGDDEPVGEPAIPDFLDRRKQLASAEQGAA